MFNILTELVKKEPQEHAHLKMDRSKTQFRRNRPVGQPEQDGSAGNGRYQEGRTGLARNQKQKT
jgi:hypothetical protein